MYKSVEYRKFGVNLSLPDNVKGSFNLHLMNNNCGQLIIHSLYPYSSIYRRIIPLLLILRFRPRESLTKMNPVWSRPIDTISYPKVWLEFTAKESKNSDRIIKYWIQDLPEDRFEDAIEHIAKHFLLDAPIPKFFGNSFMILLLNFCSKCAFYRSSHQ